MIRNPEEIQITIETSIEGKKSFLLTSDLLYQPEFEDKASLLKYPLITNQIKYPIEMLRDINITGYDKIISFFFKMDYFKNKLSQYYSNQIEKNQPDKNENLEYNTNIMLQFLFQTVFPTSNNYTDSFHEYILNENTKNIKIKNSIFSYLKINNTIYTVIKATLLNDLVNNPIYRSFIEDYIIFNEWRNTEKDKISKTNYDKYEILLRRLTNDTIYFAKDDIMKIFYNDVSQQTQTSQQNNTLDNSFDLKNIKDFKQIIENLNTFFKTDNNNENKNINNSKSKILLEIDETEKKNLNDEEKLKDEFITLFEEQKKIFEDDGKIYSKIYSKDIDDIIKIFKKIKNQKEKIQNLSIIFLKETITSQNIKKDVDKKEVELIQIFEDNKNRLKELQNIKEKDAIVDNLDSLIAELNKNKEIFEKIQKEDIKLALKESPPNIDLLNDNIQFRIKSLYDNYVEIDKYYKKIISFSFSLKYIPSDFSRNLSKCINEVKMLLTQHRIKEYIDKGDLNLRLEEDEKDFIGEIQKNYPAYSKFIDKIKSITSPNLESTNTELQKKIMKYYKSNDNAFPKLLDSINDKSLTYSQKKEMNTGVSIIKNKDNKYYSVFLALDLAEIEINHKNKYTIKCIYRSLRLGTILKNFYKNKYDEKNYRMLIKANFIKDNLKNSSITNTSSTINKGGTYTKKIFKSKFNKTRRTK